MPKLICIALLLSLTSGASAQAKPKAPAKAAPHKAIPAEPEKVKVAEGRYEMKKNGGEQDRSFAEPWTLYKTNIGYELDEQWQIGATPQTEERVIDVKVLFASGMYPIEVRMGGDDAERQLVCSMALKEFKCASSGSEAKMPIEGAYNFFSPSPWMLGSIARRSKKIPGEPTSVHLVRMAGITESGPKLGAFQADVQYVGDDEIDIGGQKLPAGIYELKAEGHIPSMLIWLSSDGIVLALQDSAHTEQRMELVEYKKVGKF